MIQECHFNPASDVEQVVPDLSVDVAEVMVTGTVLSTGVSTPYTKETEVGEVGHYLTDKIQTAIHAMKLNQSIAAARASLSPKEGQPSQGESA